PEPDAGGAVRRRAQAGSRLTDGRSRGRGAPPISARYGSSPAQWAAVVDAAPVIARAVAASAGNPGDTVRELGAFETSLTSATSYGSELPGEIIARGRGRLGAG